MAKVCVPSLIRSRPALVQVEDAELTLPVTAGLLDADGSGIGVTGAKW